MRRFFALITITVISIGMFFLSKTNLSLMIESCGTGADNFVVCGDSQVVEMNSKAYSKIKNVLNLEVVDKHEIAGRTIIEGYSNKLKNYVVISNRKVNIQISIYGDKMIVGYPLINGSF